jgi:hypothetical protein
MAIVTQARMLTFTDRLAFSEFDGCRTGAYSMRCLDFFPSHTLHESDTVAAICRYTTNQHGLKLDGDMLLTPQTAHLCIALSTASVVATFIVQFLHCRRFSLNWEFPHWKHADCFDIKPCLITLVAVSIGVDVVTWTTPHLVVWGLQLRRAHKIAITAIFAIGVTFVFQIQIPCSVLY